MEASVERSSRNAATRLSASLASGGVDVGLGP